MSNNNSNDFAEEYERLQNTLVTYYHYRNLDGAYLNFHTERHPESLESQLRKLGSKINKPNKHCLLHLREHTFSELPTHVLDTMAGNRNADHSRDGQPDYENQRYSFIKTIIGLTN
jgi:hypothetical protein